MQRRRARGRRLCNAKNKYAADIGCNRIAEGIKSLRQVQTA